MKQLLFYFILILLFAAPMQNSAYGQSLNVTVTKLPPHNYQLNNPENLLNQLILTASNTSSSSVSFNMNFALSGPMSLSVIKNQLLSSPITLGAGESISVTGDDFNDYGINSFLLDDIQPPSERSRLEQTRILREGTYTICLTAVEYNNPSSIISNEACDEFDIVYGEVPEIISPDNNSEIIATSSDLLNVTWNHYMNGAPGDVGNSVDYRIIIIDLTQANLNGFTSTPADMLDQTGIPHIVDITVSDVFSTTITDVDLQENHTYILRVTAEDPSGMIQFVNFGHSEPVIFDYVPLNDLTETLSSGSKIYAGNNGEFEITLTDDCIPNGDNEYSGTGDLVLNWLKAKIKVKFTDISIEDNNGKKYLSNGKIYATINDAAPSYPLFLNTDNASNGNWTNTKVQTIDTWLASNLNQEVSPTSDTGQAIALPIAYAVSGNKLFLAEMAITSENAQVNFIAAKTTSLLSTNIQEIGFKAESMKVHPDTWEVNSLRLNLIEDVTFVNNKRSYTFFAPSTNNSSGCYIDWSKAGLTNVNMDMQVTFDNSTLSPIDSNIAQTKIRLSGQAANWGNLLLSGPLAKSKVVGTEMLVEASSITYDMSDIINSPGIVFPFGYQGEKTVAFTGFFAKDYSLTLPDAWKVKDEPISVNTHNLLIDNSGVHLNVDEQLTKFDMNSGVKIVGLIASVNKIKVIIESNNLSYNRVEGGIILPISKKRDDGEETNESLAYTSTFHIANGESDNNFQLSIKPGSVNAAFFHTDANLTVKNTSTLTAYISKSKKYLDIDINGEFSLSTELPKIGDVDITAEVEYLKMAYNIYGREKFKFDAGSWSFASPQKTLGFPISFTDISYSIKDKEDDERYRGSLNLTVKLNLSTVISGTTTLGFVGAIQNDFTPSFEGVDLKYVAVNMNTPILKFAGKLYFIDKDPIYGNGISANVHIRLKTIKIASEGLLDFGITSYNSKNGGNYRYWHAELNTRFAPPVPFISPLAINSFGGGAFNNMEYQELEQEGNDAKNYKFVPKESGWGFIGRLGLQAQTKKTLYNAKTKLTAEFQGSSLQKIIFEGDIAVGGTVEKNDGFLKGLITAEYYNGQNKYFDLNSTIDIDKDPLHANGINLNLHVSSTNWRFLFGTPCQLNSVKIFKFDVNQYLMLGNDIPKPPSSDEFSSNFVNGYKNATDKTLNTFSCSQSTSSHTTTGGFAFGASFNQKINGYKYVCCGVGVGFDAEAGAEFNLSLSNNWGANCPGMNGWRVNGNLGFYAGANIKAGYYKTVKKGGGYSLCYVGFGANVGAQFPNPTYFAGSVDGYIEICCDDYSFSADFKVGTKCDAQDPNVTSQEDVMAMPLILESNLPNSEFSRLFYSGRKINIKYALPPNSDYSLKVRSQDGNTKTINIRLNTILTLVKISANGAETTVNIVPLSSTTEDNQEVEYSCNLKMSGAYKLTINSELFQVGHESDKTVEEKTYTFRTQKYNDAQYILNQPGFGYSAIIDEWTIEDIIIYDNADDMSFPTPKKAKKIISNEYPKLYVRHEEEGVLGEESLYTEISRENLIYSDPTKWDIPNVSTDIYRIEIKYGLQDLSGNNTQMKTVSIDLGSIIAQKMRNEYFKHLKDKAKGAGQLKKLNDLLSEHGWGHGAPGAGNGKPGNPVVVGPGAVFNTGGFFGNTPPASGHRTNYGSGSFIIRP